MATYQLWTLEQSVLGCGKKTREKASLEQVLAWANLKQPAEPVPSLVWRTELALVFTSGGFPRTDKTLLSVCRALGVSARELAMLDHLEFAVVPSGVGDRPAKSLSKKEQSYKVIGTAFGLLWTWDPTERVTRGVMYSSLEHFRSTTKVHFVLEGIKKYTYLRKNPLILALLVLRAETSDSRVYLKFWGRQLVETQVKTGRHSYPNFRRVLDVNGEDLAEMSSDVCGIAVSLSNCALRLQTLLKLADFIVDECSARTASNTKHTKPSQNLDSQNSADVRQNHLASITKYWKLKTECCLNEALSMQWRSEIVLQTVFTLTTQRDQDVSIQIARDSRTLAQQAKRDGSSMKAIAAVTMFFLPGTFVASLFATPMFAWTIPPGRSISSQFWIYWAVTLPLTLLVVATWQGWTNRKGSRQFFDRAVRATPILDVERHAFPVVPGELHTRNPTSRHSVSHSGSQFLHFNLNGRRGQSSSAKHTYHDMREDDLVHDFNWLEPK